MQKISWKKLTILFVAGVTPDQAAKVIAPRTKVGGEARERIHRAVNGILVQVRDTDPDAGEVEKSLIAEFGRGRVVDASQVRPGAMKTSLGE